MNDSQNGMLFVATDVATQDDADFNRWYDREHVEERVRVPGFIRHTLSGMQGASIFGVV